MVHDGVGQRDVDVVQLVVLVHALVHLVEGVLQHTHLPHILGSVRLVKLELDAELKLLTLNPKIFLVVDQVGDLTPFEELRLLTIALSHTDTNQTGSQEHLMAMVILG